MWRRYGVKHIIQTLILITALRQGLANEIPRLQQCCNVINNQCGGAISGPCSFISVSEELPLNTVVANFTVSDKENDAITFKVNGGADALTYFKMVRVSDTVSQLQIKSRIDSEALSSAIIQVNYQYKDPTNTPMKSGVTMNIQDINDNNPEFQNLPYRCYVNENVAKTNCTGIRIWDKDTDTTVPTITATGTNVPAYKMIEDGTPTAASKGIIRNFIMEIQEPLDFEKDRIFQITLVAKDAANHNSSTDLLIYVNDQPDQPPVFTRQPYDRSISENTTTGAEIVQIFANDGDAGIKNKITYKLDPGYPFSSYFDLNNVTGVLTLAQRIDRESPAVRAKSDFIELKVIAEEISSTPQLANLSQSSVVVHITITDVNDFVPQFMNSTYVATVVENTQKLVSFTVNPQITCRDLDSNINAKFNLTIIKNGTAYDVFSVTPSVAVGITTVRLRVNKPSELDFEKVQQFNFQILAQDTQPPYGTSTADVTVNITNANDNLPRFNQSIYTFYVPENSAIDTTVGQVFALDDDSGSFGQITYTLEGPSAAKFRINNATGEIFVAVNASEDTTLLDRDNFGGASYAMNVKAQDGGNLMAYAQVQIHLTDINDKVPIFLPTATYLANLKENKTTFERAVKVTATDQDAPSSQNSNVTFSIVDGNYGNHFAVDAITGVVSIQTAVDLENLPAELNNSNVFRLTIQGQDGGTPPLAANATVIVTVEDINDNSPIFSPSSYSISINETVAGSTPLIQVNATDADRSGPVFYRFDGGAEDKFSIDGVTGMIKTEVRAKLVVSTYNITVIAIDRGSPSRSSSTIVRIQVTDVNNVRPTFPASTFTKVIEENNEAGSELFSYPATDPDANANLVYTILTGHMTGKLGSKDVPRSIYENLFSINNNGSIIANAKLDREKVDTITFPIMVNDTNAEILTPPQTAMTTLTIVVADQNDESPKFQFPNGTTSFTVQVPESLTPPADTSLTVQAVDPDKGDVVIYVLLDPSNHFTIGRSNGVIRLVKAVDYEKNQTILMTVLCSDQVGHRASANVTVNIVDANDNSPNFTVFQTPVSVSEGEKPGFVITTVKATDADSGLYGRVSYFLNSNGGGKFAINETSGEISLAATVDREATGGTTYSIAVEARDNVGGTSNQGRTSKLMEVKVLDVNDEAPTFPQSSYNFSDLNENAGPNVKIDEIAARDNDAGNNSKLSYSLLPPANGSSNALTLFKVETLKDSSSYRAVLRTAKSLKNAVGCHEAILLATDAGNPQKNGTANLAFCVNDVNDFTPTFKAPPGNQTLVVNVPEGVLNPSLYTVRAEDTDQGNNGMVRYRLSSSSGDHEKFQINSVTGVLSNKVKLDRETKAQYRFQIVAYDLGIPSLSSALTVKVDVSDANDHTPSFPAAHKRQTFSFPENLPPNVQVKPGVMGRLIGNVSQAADSDTGVNAVICYFIVSKGFENVFYLDKRTGGLYSIASLDRETKSSYTLTIKAVGNDKCDSNDYVFAPRTTGRRLLYLADEIKYNASDPSLSQIHVTVADVNDNPPKFDRKFFFDGVTKDSPPLTVIINFKLFVTDKDAGNNSNHVYSVNGPMEISQPLKQQLEQKGLTNVLTVGSSSGLLTTGQKIYFQENMQGYFRFVVKVTDNAFSDTANVTVYLLNEAQRVVVVFRDTPANVGLISKKFADYMSNITGLTVNVDNIVTHKKEDGQAESSMTDMYIHAYDPTTHKIIPATELIKILDAKWQSLRTLYNTYNVIRVRNSQQTTPTTTPLEVLRIALILTACVLGLLVLITCISLWTCRRMYRRKLKAATTIAFGSSNGMTHNTPMPGTNRYTYEGSNPIWMAQYENFAMKDDIASDRDSLDENALNKQKYRENDEQEVVLNLNDESDTEDGSPRHNTDDQNELLDAAINQHDLQKGNGRVPPTTAPQPPLTGNGNLAVTSI